MTSSECVGLDVLSFPLVPSSVALVACFVEAISDPGFFGRELKLNQMEERGVPPIPVGLGDKGFVCVCFKEKRS